MGGRPALKRPPCGRNMVTKAERGWCALHRDPGAARLLGEHVQGEPRAGARPRVPKAVPGAEAAGELPAPRGRRPHLRASRTQAASPTRAADGDTEAPAGDRAR